MASFRSPVSAFRSPLLLRPPSHLAGPSYLRAPPPHVTVRPSPPPVLSKRSFDEILASHRGFSRPQTWVVLILVAMHERDYNPHLQKTSVPKTLTFPETGLFAEYFDGDESTLALASENNPTLTKVLEILKPFALDKNFSMRTTPIEPLIQSKLGPKVNFVEWLYKLEEDYSSESVVRRLAYWWYRMEGVFNRPILMPPRFRPWSPFSSVEEQIQPTSELAWQVSENIAGPIEAVVPPIVVHNVSSENRVTPMEMDQTLRSKFPAGLQPKFEVMDEIMPDAARAPEGPLQKVSQPVPHTLSITTASVSVPSTSGVTNTLNLPSLLTFPSSEPSQHRPYQAGEFAKFFPLHNLGPKSYDYHFEIHVFDPQHNHFVLVRGNNEGPHGIVGLSADYISAENYHRANYKDRKHVPLNITPK